jgi:ATP-dependent Clp protease ATP-binding subunit ClpB
LGSDPPVDSHPRVDELLAQRGWDPVYGARPLKRAIQRYLQDPLAMMLLEGEFSENETVQVDVTGNELTFSKAKVATQAA